MYVVVHHRAHAKAFKQDLRQRRAGEVRDHHCAHPNAVFPVDVAAHAHADALRFAVNISVFSQKCLDRAADGCDRRIAAARVGRKGARAQDAPLVRHRADADFCSADIDAKHIIFFRCRHDKTLACVKFIRSPRDALIKDKIIISYFSAACSGYQHILCANFAAQDLRPAHRLKNFAFIRARLALTGNRRACV